MIATQLVFATQPVAPSANGSLLIDFSTDPLVQAQDANGLLDSDFTDTVTLSESGAGNATFANHSVSAVAGVATFTHLTLTYNLANASGESFSLQADDTAAGAEGDLTTLPTSNALAVQAGLPSLTSNGLGLDEGGSMTLSPPNSMLLMQPSLTRPN